MAGEDTAGRSWEVRELGATPSTLELYARTLAPLLPGAQLLPFVGGRGGEMPELELRLARVTVDPDRLATYARVCGMSLRETLPATYPHVLAFPLHLALMADRRFPFAAVGLVHISNRIVLHRPIHVEEPLDLRVHATEPRPHARGHSFALVSQARIAEELVWEEQSTMLRRGAAPSPQDGSDVGSASAARSGSSGSASESGSGSGSALESGSGSGSASESGSGSGSESIAPSSRWRLPGDLGRRYAGVSGDRNPIHMHAFSARAFGFPGAIAHGMWTKARCLAALEGELPDGYTVEVTFRRPIQLPAQVVFGEELGEDPQPEKIRFAVTDAERGTMHLEGEVWGQIPSIPLRSNPSPSNSTRTPPISTRTPPVQPQVNTRGEQ